VSNEADRSAAENTAGSGSRRETVAPQIPLVRPALFIGGVVAVAFKGGARRNLLMIQPRNTGGMAILTTWIALGCIPINVGRYPIGILYHCGGLW